MLNLDVQKGVMGFKSMEVLCIQKRESMIEIECVCVCVRCAGLFVTAKAHAASSSKSVHG